MTDEFIRDNIEPVISAMEVGDFHRAVRKLAQELGGTMDEGASRLCMIFPNDDEVIKIPYLDNTSTDYCAKELANYESAKRYGVEKILLPVRKFGEYDNGASIYIQPKYSFCHSDAEVGWLRRKRDEITYQRIRASSVFTSLRCKFYQSRISDDWLMFVYAKYGKKFCRSLIKWTNDCKVNDLHMSNVGYLHGNPIILDYAGYFGSSY